MSTPETSQWEQEVREKLSRYRGLLPINPCQLDTECNSQASFYDEVGRFHSEMKSHARSAKDSLEFTTAQLKKEARLNPGTFGIAKVTESAVQEAITVDDRYQKALRHYSEMQYLADCASVLLTAAEQKKTMLKEAVSLYVNEYYSSQDRDMRPQRSAINKVSEEEIVRVRREAARRRDEQVGGANEC